MAWSAVLALGVASALLTACGESDAPGPTASLSVDESDEDLDGARPDDLPSHEPAVPPTEIDFSEVTYTIQRSGTIARVANLYMIPHHEVLALNPGKSLDTPLSAGARVVVAKVDPTSPSHSIGSPGAGKLEGGLPMLEGPGRIIKAERWKTWGTAETVAILDDVLRAYTEEEPHSHPILVGNLSAQHGGRLEPHGSHQSGRDADLSFVQLHDGKGPKGDQELDWRDMNALNLDGARTWTLLRLLIATGRIEGIYIDTGVQKLLYDHAIATGTPTKGQLEQWLEYPRAPGTTHAVITHIPGHDDHLHVRLTCSRGDTGCQSKRDAI